MSWYHESIDARYKLQTNLHKKTPLSEHFRSGQGWLCDSLPVAEIRLFG